MWWLIALLIPSVVATLVAQIAGPSVQNAIRKFFIVLLYLNPWFWGTSFDWNKAAKKSETFLIVWFFVFFLTAVVTLAMLHG